MKQKKELKKEEKLAIKIGAIGGAVACTVGFAVGYVFACRHGKPKSNSRLLSIVTDKRITRPGIAMTPMLWNKIKLARHIFLFDNTEDAKEFVELFTDCINDCEVHIEKLGTF